MPRHNPVQIYKGNSRKDWLDVRMQGVGGSEVASIMGQNKFKSIFQVWYDKTSDEHGEQPSNDAMYWGNVLEPVVIKHFRTVNKLKVKDMRNPKATYAHPDYPYMIANVDNIICKHPTDPEMFKGEGILEVKTTNARNEKDWSEGAPLYYYLQAMHYVEVMGLEWCCIACLVGGQTYYQYYYQRNDDVIARIKKSIIDFWGYVESKTPPPIDDSEEAGKFLAKNYSPSNEYEVVAEPEIIPLFDRYLDLNEEIKILEKEKQSIKNKVGDFMKYNDRLNFPNRGYVLWRTSVTTRIDNKKLAKENPELVKKYEVESPTRAMRFYPQNDK